MIFQLAPQPKAENQDRQKAIYGEEGLEEESQKSALMAQCGECGVSAALATLQFNLS